MFLYLCITSEIGLEIGSMLSSDVRECVPTLYEICSNG